VTLINLIPAEVHRAAVRRSRLLCWAAIVALSGVLAAIPYSLSIVRENRFSKLREEVDSIDVQATNARNQLRLATGLAQQLYTDLERSRALRSKRAWSGMFALIASCLPPDCWLHSVATDPESPGASAGRPTVVLASSGPRAAAEPVIIEAPRKLLLVGYSTSDSQPLVFVSNLRESNVFTQVALQKAMRAPFEKDASEAILHQFEIVCEW
jgi:hypothetical protein